MIEEKGKGAVIPATSPVETMDYLRRIRSAALRLAVNAEESPQKVEAKMSGGAYVNDIARALLAASCVSTLCRGVDDLPPRPCIQSPHDLDSRHIEAYQLRRVDYLRELLRAMAPISIDVAALVCSIVRSSLVDDATRKIKLVLCKAAFILFSQWLEVAPHIKPLVSDLFRLSVFDCPLIHAKEDPAAERLLLMEAAYNLCQFYWKQREPAVLKTWWSWSQVFGQTDANDDMNIDGESQEFTIRWYRARVVTEILDLNRVAKMDYLERHGVEQELVAWVMHPWALAREEYEVQRLQILQRAKIWTECEFYCPSASEIRGVIPLHQFLLEIGPGLVFVKHSCILDPAIETIHATAEKSHPRLFRTTTSARNLSLVGTALCEEPNPPPILLCGPAGSGKSSLVRELASMFAFDEHTAAHHDDQLLEIHVDEETDTKTLVGSYTTTDVPGEFEWRPGALTRAIRSGKWVLLEDLDSIPIEIQASLVQLLKSRLLPLGNGKVERCHPNFRLFGTLTILPDVIHPGSVGGKRILSPTMWRHIRIEPLPLSELKEIAVSMHKEVPGFVVDCVLKVFTALDQSGRTTAIEDDFMDGLQLLTRAIIGRNPSVRDLFKVLSRIAHNVVFESGVSYATEGQRTLCLAETYDIFVAACPDRNFKEECLRSIFAPTWGVSADLALSYIDRRRPEPVVYPAYTEVGRARIPIPELYIRPNTDKETFAQTSYALRLMESIGVCIAENEPTLLVGETGCGKTTILQHLARLSGRDLVVQNLSLQTDSTDLLGGFRPLEIQQVARSVYQNFVDLFTSSFSRKQNADFLAFTSDAMKRGNWKRLSQCFRKAAKLGIDKVKERSWDSESSSVAASWRRFEKSTGRFEQQRLACNSGLAFVFAEGALIEAITRGKWVLLDEINLASSETLQRLCGLLDDPTSSITLTERGDGEPVERHPDFRLFAAMNPATDSGKKDLHASIRSRFTELYVDELLDPLELRVVAERYICAVLPVTDTPPEHTETVVKAVDVYLECRSLAERVLVDGSGQKPRYTLRTLSRALTASQIYVLQQKLPLQRALYEGFELAFQGPLSQTSLKPFCDLLTQAFASGLKKEEMDHPGRRPGGTAAVDRFALIKPFWIEKGPLESIDWSELNSNARSKFVLTRSTTNNLRRLARAVASGPWPILLEGPTSAGKTSLVEYLAARCGHHVIRINNHEHTDVQEYTGSFAADSSGRLAFQDGLLVRALREGHWVILDELNLAPSEVLEALNRLLDDNRELYLPETNETVRPKHGFRLFATQNPSGVYGGRKPLSRAFRNRFTELHLDDIPSSEMITILEKRSGCPPQHAKILVSIMDALRLKRSKSGVFLGKNSFITPRDLLRWAERHATGKIELAHEGFMLLGERLRTREEKDCVREEIEKHLNVKIDLETLYFSESSEARSVLHRLFTKSSDPNNQKLLATIAPTRSLLRLVTLVLRCVRQREPVLLVGDTGCGKTTAVQLLSCVLESELHTINCHATTETSDLLGGLRPVRGRPRLVRRMLDATVNLCGCWPQRDAIALQSIPGFVNEELAKTTKASEVYTGILPDDAVDQMVELARALWKSRSGIIQSEPSSRRAKRQKVDGKESPSSTFERDNWDQVSCLVKEVEDLARAYNALFEWSDGPLVKAVKAGDMILLDEISLAEDAVLERLNSVLEPSRTLVLAEKGSADDVESRVLIAHECFQLFATMNPGGDFGKRELSPALRSRFTEIWVPAVTDSADIDFVLERSLAQSAFEEGTRSDVKRKMIEYFNWFNEHLCTDPSRPYAELALSLRDILTWAAFITACTQAGDDLDIWGIYYHGACLMHLDGLGLGTALASHDSASAKNKAIEFLMEHVPVDKRSTLGVMTNGFNVLDAKFGCNTFRIPVGQDHVAEADFNLEAPTTSVNIFRILRAMQLSKPVLLEGSPGVGKTTLVAALAAASGHKLVRINLSDQTDISDLFGSDLPVPEKDASGNNSASFSWCDGVLLSAIKKGDWVLLDELNLASQAVLEGLNSCLDHRASVYIPELGSSFRCPASFRIFAAQNPLAQGGGRKGLPKSFLNRFTKVFVDSLTDDDLRVILTAKFPSLDEKLIDRVIAFNSRINCDVVQDRLYGQSGAPWEFNLRDVFRWCELLRFDLFGQISISLPLVLARDLYFQRFRAQHDREIAKERYLSIFGSVDQKDPRCKLATTPLEVLVGSVRLARLRGPDITRGPYVVESPLSLIHFQALEAVARCISKNWPCLLVGPAVVGKSSTIGCLAELTGRKLVEICLSPSSDVSELVGCFEQVDGLEDYRVAFASICRVAEEYLLLGGSETEKVCDLLNSIRSADDEVEGMRFAQHIASLLFTELRSRVDLNPIVWDDLAASRDLLLNYNGKMSTIGGHFVWKDGILIEAMEKGYWLHLKHVNLCPASVLDRLNSVMEPNGSLLLAECSSAGEDGGTRHRQVHCHPDFRIFLSMNPEYGEVSRAMRNRCVEIALMDHPALAYEGSYVDAINRLQRIGLRSQLLADTILKRCETSSLVESCGKVMCRLLLRGVTGFGSIASATEVMLGSIEKDHDPWLEKVDIEGASFDRILSFSDMKGQFLSNSMNTVSWEGRALEKFLCKRGTHSTFFPLIHSLGDHHMGISGPNFILLRNHMIALYLCKSTNLDISLRASFLDTFDGSLSGSLHFAANYMMRLLGGPNTTESKIRFPAEGRFDMQHFLSIAFNKVYFRRIPQTLVEQAWYQEQRKTIRSRSFEGSSELCALQVSFLLSTGQIDRSEVVCPVTPHLYPFFNVLDNLIDLIYQDPSNDFGVAPKIDDVLRDRDGLWNLTKNLAFSSSRVDFLCFDEIDFIVQWKWLCDSLQQMSKFVGSFATDNGQERRKLSALSDTIERELYYGGSVRISCSIAKRSNKPFVPKTTEGWNLNMQSRDLAEKCSIWSQRCEIAGERVGDELLLDDLVQHQHPALYVDSEMKEQILAVISMSYLATTGEAGDDGLTERRNLSRQALTAVQARLSVARKHFEQNINLVQMDGQIHTIDNMMSVDDLNALSDASDSVQQLAKTFSQRLMEKFAYMQIAPSAEYWCERQEQFLIRWFCKLLCQVEGDVYCDIQFLAEPIRKFLDVGLHQTFWNLADLRPYQTLLWSLEKKESRDPCWRKLLKNLLPVMTYNASIRVWSNCTVHLKGISQRIEFSNIKETCVLRGSKQSDPQEEALDDLDTLDVPTSTALSLVGGCFTVVHNEAKYLPFSTIENHQARVKQSEALVGIFTIVANGIADTFFPYELFYLFLETVHSLKNSFSSDDFVALNAILRNPTLWNSSQCGDLRRILILSSNELFLDLVDPLVMPLFDLLRRSRSCQSSETTEYGEALIQLGLLRFHLLLPDSPLDPAREPEAKVRALKISKDRLKIERCAIQMDSGLQCGDFCPSHERTKEIDGQLDLIKALHSKHVDRIVSRPVDAPSFVGLYRETNEGARRFLSVAAVHALMHLRSSDFSSASSVQTIANWQSTTEAFCERILSTYAVFEDVVVPLIDCVAMVNRGLKLFFRPTRDSPSGKADLAVAFKFALTFPVSDYDSVFDSAHLMLRSVRLKSVNAHRELAISILSHLVSRRRVAGFDRRSLLLWNHVVRLVAEDETVDNASLPKSDEELEEIEFRRQFPDHSLDFQSLVQHSDEEERDRENLSNSESPAISTLFREEFKVILYSLHRDMFYAKTGMTDESDRVKSFRLQYGTAFLLHRAAAVENSNSLGAAGHIVALALATPSFKGTFVGEQSDYRRGHVYDFHKDPNPVEALKSCEPLLSLQARVSQLLTAFPGNEILLAIARVIDRLKRFDLSVVPLGKLLRGMELLLRQSQDWEQHASERVQLGDSLRSVSETVARWRKAELFSWSSLLTNREAQFQRNAHGHWYKLYRLFMIDPCDDTLGSAESTRINSLDRSTPAWLWKGVNFEGIRLTPAKTPFGTLSELVKALDTFILTSPLGEVGTRLGMIENFAMEKRAEYLHMSAGVECLHLARTLSSLWAYYHQFTAFFLTKISEKRRPLEKRLHEEAKLAKWDEQSYYALSESTEKNYRKLMRILREYDEVLHINVGVILEDELYKGIGQDTDTTRPTTSIPGEAELFPFCPGISKDQEVCICPKTWPAVDPKRSWTNVVGFAVPVEQRSILVSKYLTKMFKLHITERTNPESWGSMGAQEASHLSLSIFDRIQRLRSEKTTRPMKERAVTDLLKELKRQGYASTKWSIPKEIQQVESIFQLPSLLSEQRGIGENELIYLQNAEEYYQKCLLEANRLRSEITMMGSRHLTQRQLDIFLSSGEHGLLLLAQQRGVLSSIIIDRRHLQVNVNTLSEVTSSLPTGQTYLNKMVKDLTMKIAASSECMAQTALVLRARSHLTSREDVRSWTRDRTVSMLDLGSRLVKRRIFGGPLVLDRLLVQIHETKTELRSALTLLEDCRYDCMRHGFLPVDSLDTCKKALDLAVEQAARCHEQVTLRDVENPLSFLPRFVEAHSQAVEAALFAVQAVVGNIDGQDVSPSIWDCHRSAIAEWSSVNTNRLSDRLFEVLNQLRLVHDINGLDHEQQQICVGLATDLSFLFAEAMRILDDRLVQFLRFHREAAKLHYVLLRIFRTLCAKGYCSDKTKDGEEEGEGEASGMTFEDDKDGTGMGEGEGKRDVTDEIENEEQLLGLKNEAQNEEKNSEEKGSKQLDEEEAEKGMEMEADFNGEMYDMPDPTPDVRDNDEEDTKEELDREMGEEGGANEEVIDEKMWNDSDNDEDQGDAQDEKLEKDSGVEGGAAGDELTTKDDTKGKEEKEAPQSGDSHKDQANDDPQEDETTAEMVNEDSDDRYEDNHGVNVRDEKLSDEKPDEQQMELDDNLELNDGSPEGNEGDQSSEETIEDVENDDALNKENDNPGNDVAADEQLSEENVEAEDLDTNAIRAENAIPDEVNDEEPEDDSNPDMQPPSQMAREPTDSNEGLGVRAQDGTDAVQDDTREDDDAGGDGKGEEEEVNGQDTQASEMEPSGAGGSSSGANQGQGLTNEGQNWDTSQPFDEIPNPLKNPGDATKYWHRRLNIVQPEGSNDELLEISDQLEQQKTNENAQGDFEYVGENQQGTTQALGEVEDTEAMDLDEIEAEVQGESVLEKEPQRTVTDEKSQEKRRSQTNKDRGPTATKDENAPNDNEDTMDEDGNDFVDRDEASGEYVNENDSEQHATGNQVMADLSQLQVQDDSVALEIYRDTIVEESVLTGASLADQDAARAQWSMIVGNTHSLSRRLCEKLRLVLEPLVASKLRGDYRTGKRINMKRVIGYVASGYRKDKIWLRRTKPAKRDYRILLAVDDSESMKAGAGDIALHALATLANGMGQLDVGELGVASFGNEMRLLHDFHQPFTAESGANVVRNFTFAQPRTRTALCVESALQALDAAGGNSSMQLVFLISDGRIERDSRETLRRLIREMMERNILLAMVIVESSANARSSSIVNMKEVSFENGKPKVKSFIEDYPFPYYIVLKDMQTLPEVLGDALRQWFEMLLRLQTKS